ncbi:hypothetical protein M8C21_009440, partial [Ambrosia artemisiifolia]
MYYNNNLKVCLNQIYKNKLSYGFLLVQGTIETWKKNNETMHYYFEKNDTTCYSYDVFSTIAYHKQLVNRNCQVLIISGDHDMTFPYVGTEEWIKSLNVPIETPWNPWFVDSQVA